MKKTLLAYFAGVIDSDGTIGIKKSTYSMRVTGDSRQPTYSERVCLKQVEVEAAQLLHHHFKGYLGSEKPQANNRRSLVVWQVTDLRATTFLKAILPFLRIKRNQAKNCLRLRRIKERSKKARVAFGRGHAGSAPRSAILGRQMEECLAEAHRLNRVGM